MLNSFYTYLHRRQSDNAVFYVGKGRERRAYARNSRSQYWLNTVEKHGLKVEIVAHWKTEREALDHEKFLIWCFRDMGVDLCNHTDGGEGVSGMTHSDMTKSLMSITRVGRQHKPETRQKIASALSGKKKTKEHAAKSGFARRGKKLTQEWRKNISLGMMGKKDSPATIAKRIASNSGAKHHSARQVRCDETGQVFDTAVAAATWLKSQGHANACQSAIGRVCKGKTATAYGLKWSYATGI